MQMTAISKTCVHSCIVYRIPGHDPVDGKPDLIPEHIADILTPFVSLKQGTKPAL